MHQLLFAKTGHYRTLRENKHKLFGLKVMLNGTIRIDDF